MSTLHDEALRGTLTGDSLMYYLAGIDPSFIDSVGGSKKVTPLAGACWRGHLEVVRLLLDNGADPDALSPNERPPLYYAVSRSPTKNRAEIVRRLLDAGATVDMRFPQDDNNTALMNAISETRDKDVVRLLVDHGASTTLENVDGNTAQTLAKEAGMEQQLKTKAKRNVSRGIILDLIVALVVFVIAYVDNGLVKDVLAGTVSKLFGGIKATKDMSGMEKVAKDVLGPRADKFLARPQGGSPPKRLDPARAIDSEHKTDRINVRDSKFSSDDDSEKQGFIQQPGQSDVADASDASQDPQPQMQEVHANQDHDQQGEPELVTIGDFAQSLGNYVSESGLDKFFAPGDQFIHDLARKAAALRADTSTTLSTPENIKRLITLSLYRPIMYCDDSGSMSLEGRFARQRELVARMARIATKIVPEDCGVDLRFINHRDQNLSNLSAAQIDQALTMASPRGGTRIGTTLRGEILVPSVYDKLDGKSTVPFNRPILVCVITDGDPSNEPRTAFRDAITECRKRLGAAGYESTAVMFCISQIGNDEKATQFLGDLRDDEQIKDMLYCTSDRLDSKFEEFKANEDRLEEWLLKLLTKPIMERYED